MSFDIPLAVLSFAARSLQLSGTLSLAGHMELNARA
jgi:hypothetical protein